MPGTGKKFSVSLVTPDGAAFEGEAEMIIVPGAIGEIGVLARHAPLVATLKAGSTRIHPGGDADVLEYATGPGRSGRPRGDRTRRVDRRPLADRAADPSRREPARRRRPRLTRLAVRVLVEAGVDEPCQGLLVPGVDEVRVA
jgi:hypothetical protein